MNGTSQYQNSQKAKSARLRSWFGLLLFTVYALGNFVFSQSALCVFGQISGQHEVLIRGDQVILHHAQSTPRSFVELLVSMSHTNSKGDHELPCAPLVFADPEPSTKNTSHTQSINAHDDDQTVFHHHALDQPDAMVCGVVRNLIELIAGDAMISHWRTVKRMV
jgi:hypothetical protein